MKEGKNMCACKFCSMHDNGDIPQDHKSVLYKQIGSILGAALRIRLLVIPVRSKKYNAVVDLSIGNDETREVDFKIRYCPMCGRDLRKIWD